MPRLSLSYTILNRQMIVRYCQPPLCVLPLKTPDTSLFMLTHTAFCHTTMIQYDSSMSQTGYEFDIMCGNQNRYPHLVELREQIHDLARQFQIKIACRLIRQ